MSEGISKTAKRLLLITAGVLILVAVGWFLRLETSGYTRTVCDRINEFGYNVSPSGLRINYYAENERISDFENVDFTAVVPLSRQCGFDSDIYKVGRVELYDWQLNDYYAICIWLVDGEPELVYISNKMMTEFYPLDGL